MDDAGYVLCECAGCVPTPLPDEVLVVLPLNRYEADLGMRTRGALHRQLAVDVPRCIATVDGVRVEHGDDPRWRRVAHARLCTQAVLAPPVEWLMRAGIVAHESGAPMRVDARGARLVEVRKELRVRAAEGGGREGSLWLRVHADGATNTVSVELKVVWSTDARGARGSTRCGSTPLRASRTTAAPPSRHPPPIPGCAATPTARRRPRPR